MQNERHENLVEAVEAAVKRLGPFARDPAAMVGFLGGLTVVSLHMMIVFHLVLLFFAILAGPGGASPHLMKFIFYWYLAAVVLWPVKNLVERSCCSPLGVFIILFTIFILVYLFQSSIVQGLENLALWVSEAKTEIFS